MTTNGHLLADAATGSLPQACAALYTALIHSIPRNSSDHQKPSPFSTAHQPPPLFTVSMSRRNHRLAPAKVNAVLVRGINDDEVEASLPNARENRVIMRFIEFSPLDADRHWTRALVGPRLAKSTSASRRWPLQQIPHERIETRAYTLL